MRAAFWAVRPGGVPLKVSQEGVLPRGLYGHRDGDGRIPPRPRGCAGGGVEAGGELTSSVMVPMSPSTVHWKALSPPVRSMVR